MQRSPVSCSARPARFLRLHLVLNHCHAVVRINSSLRHKPVRLAGIRRFKHGKDSRGIPVGVRYRKH